MASTDSPLKRLVSTFIADFASWLLKTQVQEARPLNIELPGETLVADQVFRVVLADGRQVILHIEFQGAGVTLLCHGGCWNTSHAWLGTTVWSC